MDARELLDCFDDAELARIAKVWGIAANQTREQTIKGLSAAAEVEVTRQLLAEAKPPTWRGINCR